MNMTRVINEKLQRPLTSLKGEQFVVDTTDLKFCAAVSWAFHDEQDEDILKEFGDVDIDKVKVVAQYLDLCEFEFDQIYEWGELPLKESVDVQ